MTDLGLYVYGLVADGQLPEIPGEPGIDEAHGVELITHGAVQALVSRVSLDQFDEQSLHARLADMQWVERTARAHQRVLDAVLDRTTPIPMRLCTLYSDEDGLRQMLDAQQEELAAVLSELHGKLEWGVKAFAGSQPAAGATAGSAAASTSAPTKSGTAYLREQLAARRAGDRAHEDLAETCDRLHDELAKLAVAARVGLPQHPDISGREAPMVLNAFYLVAGDARERFRTRFAELRGDLASSGIELELTGPWPPYNFIPAAVGGAS